MRHIPLIKCHSFYKTSKGNTIELYRPYSISMGNSGIKLFRNSNQKALNRAFHRLKSKPDVCYGHFWNPIFMLFPLAKQANIPLCGASGEENVACYVRRSDDNINKLRDYISGVISVSTKNQQECFALNLVTPEKSTVIPNAIDQSLFRLMNKSECRSKLGLDDRDFIVAFVGQFVPRKGTLRLSEALTRIGDPSIKAVFIGSGSDDPHYAGIIHKGRVAHDDVPCWLNAADVFVLPTENEGCCNAIIEAMACGLPIISTDAPFNYDILNDNNSIMVDCNDIVAIAAAIKKLKEDEALRCRLSEGALKTAERLSIRRRAERIVEFMEERIQK